MNKSDFVGLLAALAFGLVGAFVGLLVFIYLVRNGWADDPTAADMFALPLVVVPAFGFGMFGFLRRVSRLRRRAYYSRIAHHAASPRLSGSQSDPT